MTPEQHRAVQSSIETLATRDLVRLWRTLDLQDAEVATRLLLPQVRELVAAYGELSAVTAADFYETARQTAGARGEFVAQPAGTAPAGQVDALTRWSVTPIWSDDPRSGAALARLAGGAQRLIRKAERDTIFDNGQRDDTLARWIRIAQHDACDFCLMLASRGDVYLSKESAGGSLGQSYHDNCRCETVPVWSPADIPPETFALQAEWDNVTAGEEDQLGAWRQHINETRPNQHVTRN